MKNTIIRLALGVAAVFSALAVPAHADSILSFSGNTTGGTITVNGSGTVTGISNVPYTELTVGANLYPLTSGFLSLSGTTLTLSGDITSLGINSPTALLTVQLASSLTNTGSTSVLNVGPGSATSVTESTTLLSDLGITGPVTSTFLGVGLIGTGSNGVFTVTSDTLAASVAVPEPSSLPLLAIGLMTVALFALKRSSRQVRA